MEIQMKRNNFFTKKYSPLSLFLQKSAVYQALEFI